MFKKIVILTVFVCILPRYAYAYINPGVGSYISQIIIAALVVGLFFIKVLFNKIKNYFAKLFFRKNIKL